MEDGKLVFFEGFEWAVPGSFADPLSNCRFEQGDLLYDRPEAYLESWSQVRDREGFAIQVLEPSRGVAAKSGSQDHSAFADSWGQKVVFDWYNLKTGESRIITTSQGRLYRFLWRGNQSILEDETTLDIPLQAVDLKKFLPQVTSRFQNELLPNPNIIRFLLPIDGAAGLYHEKFLKVQKALESHFQTTTERVSANNLGLDREFLPTVQVACFEIQEATRQAVEETLQNVLYNPGASRKTEAVRFRLSAHGVLV